MDRAKWKREMLFQFTGKHEKNKKKRQLAEWQMKGARKGWCALFLLRRYMTVFKNK